MLYYVAIIILWMWFVDGDQWSCYADERSKLLTRLCNWVQFVRDIFMQRGVVDDFRTMFGKPMHCTSSCIFNWILPDGVDSQRRDDRLAQWATVYTRMLFGLFSPRFLFMHNW